MVNNNKTENGIEKILGIGIAVGALGLGYLLIKDIIQTPLVNLISNNSFENLDSEGKPLLWNYSQSSTNAKFILDNDIYGKTVSIEYLTNSGEQAYGSQNIGSVIPGNI